MTKGVECKQKVIAKVKNMNMKEYSGLSSDKTTNVKEAVPIHLKMTLTIKEAAEYSNIGINKIDALLKQPNCPFVLFVGNKKLVKRRAFEEFISAKLII